MLDNEDLSGVERPGRIKRSGWQTSKKELLAQGIRYLSASSQDTHPAYGLVHASYARLIFEGLSHEGDYFPQLLRKAGELQEVWTHKILRSNPLGLMSDPRLTSELREILSA